MRFLKCLPVSEPFASRQRLLRAVAVAALIGLGATPAVAAGAPGSIVLAQATPAATGGSPAPAPAPASAPVSAPASAIAPDAGAPGIPPPPQQFDVVSMVLHADVVVQCVMGFLVLCSIATWTILIEKTFSLGRARKLSSAFLTNFRGARTVQDIARKTAEAAPSPISHMWRVAKEEWDLFQVSHANGNITAHQADGLVQRMAVAANIAQESEMLRMSSSMGILATIGSTSPFIGLFGTVWGILTSFVGIAASKATSLSAVAPGIAEALLATAIGLVAAIPAVMIYNKFARQISQVSGMLDNFQGELATVVSRELEVVG